MDITLQGDREGLRNLRSEHIHALVYLSDVKNGSEIQGRIEVTTPPGFTHVSVVPAEVQIIPPVRNGVTIIRTNSP